MIFIIIATLCFVLLCIRYAVSKNELKIPLGLKEIPLVQGLPIIGILHRAKPTLHHFLRELGKVHGPIFRIKFGFRDIIVLNDFDVIKKTLKDNGDNFSGRVKLKSFDFITHNSGILFQDGPQWAKQRSFILKVLRDFGLGKSKSAEIVQNECIHLLEELKEIDGKCVDFSNTIPNYTANIISKFIMSKRFSRDDPRMHLIDKIMNETGKRKDPIEVIHVMFPVLDRFDFLMRIIGSKLFDDVYEMFRKEIQEHLEVLDLNSEGEDLIDRFLIEQHHATETYGTVQSFTNWQLIRGSFELFVAGYETTSTTLNWSMLFMARFPEIQNKVYTEIIDEIGEERLVTMNDKRSLAYTQAVMDEILRWSTVVPISILHRNFEDCSVNGYFIPKNSALIPHLFAIHFDPNLWEKPNEFYPEHFLTKENPKKMRYNPREELNPFSMGKRQCLGESLARMEYFMFFVSILQQFRVRFVEELTEEQYKDVLIGNDGLIRCSKMKNFTFTKR